MLLVFQSKCVFHQHEVHVIHGTCLNGEDAKDFGQQAVRIGLEVVLEAGKQLEQEIHLRLGYRLDDELLVL